MLVVAAGVVAGAGLVSWPVLRLVWRRRSGWCCGGAEVHDALAAASATAYKKRRPIEHPTALYDTGVRNTASEVLS